MRLLFMAVILFWCILKYWLLCISLNYVFCFTAPHVFRKAGFILRMLLLFQALFLSGYSPFSMAFILSVKYLDFDSFLNRSIKSSILFYGKYIFEVFIIIVNNACSKDNSVKSMLGIVRVYRGF